MLETFCLLVQCLRVPQFAAWRRRLEIEEGLPEHQETMPPLSHTILRPRGPGWSFHLEPRSWFPQATELWLVWLDKYNLLIYNCTNTFWKMWILSRICRWWKLASLWSALSTCTNEMIASIWCSTMLIWLWLCILALSYNLMIRCSWAILAIMFITFVI